MPSSAPEVNTPGGLLTIGELARRGRQVSPVCPRARTGAGCRERGSTVPVPAGHLGLEIEIVNDGGFDGK
jgi:hypothetical protein